MKCAKCGAELENGQAFCRKCGTKVEIADICKNDRVNKNTSFLKNNKRIILIASVSAIIIAAIVVTVVLFTNTKSKTELYYEMIAKAEKIEYTRKYDKQMEELEIECYPEYRCISETTKSKNGSFIGFNRTETTNYDCGISGEQYYGIIKMIQGVQFKYGEPDFDYVVDEKDKVDVNIDDIDNVEIDMYITDEKAQVGISFDLKGKDGSTDNYTEWVDFINTDEVEAFFKNFDEEVRRENNISA